MQAMARITILIVLVGLTWGCASKKYVREKLAPVGDAAQAADSRSMSNSEHLSGLNAKVSEEVTRLEKESEQGLAAASDEAAKAQGSADRAMVRADDAMLRADSAHDGVDALGRTVEGLGQYRLVDERAILFGFDSDEMTPEAEGLLSDLMDSVNGDDFVVEVRGFTDSVGSAAYNLELSRRRAEAVVRSIHTGHGVALRQIHRVGLGEDGPTEGNESRDGRSMNRRVEVSLLSTEGGSGSIRVE